MVIVIDETEEELEELPSSLEEFFEEFPSIGEANEALTSIDHVDMWRDQVLFIKQRQQATSDYRENPNVRWIGMRLPSDQVAFQQLVIVLGSHAAMTCHIVVMRHVDSGVVSLGHFDNFCCWQFGENSSAHRDGLDIMVKEISALSSGDVSYIEVTVVGGYTDVRGDAEKNSLSLLSALHHHRVKLYLKHFCVGRYNTQFNPSTRLNEAILKGIAIDLKEQTMFPAIYNWGRYEDFKKQLATKFRTRQYDEESAVRITADSTFKPKSLKNHSMKGPKTEAETTETKQTISGKPLLKRGHSKTDTSKHETTTSFPNVRLKPVKKSLGFWGSTPTSNRRNKKMSSVKTNEQYIS